MVYRTCRTNGYRPPSDVVTGLKDLIKAERRGLNIRYAEEKIVSKGQPQSGYQQGAQTLTSYQTGLIRIEYEENNQTFEEEFYGQSDITNMEMPSAMGNMETIFWGGTNLYSCKAPK